MLALTLVAGAQDLPLIDGEEEVEEDPGFLAGTLLPDGSILKGVMLPRYDAELKIVSAVRADELIIVDSGRIDRKKARIDAKNLIIEMYDDAGVPDARIAMKRARFIPPENLLTSDDPVSIVAERLTADGAGLVFDTKNSRGFLRGPVKAVTEFDSRTAMNARPARHALAAGALLMASAAALPAQEKEPTTAERFAGLRLKPEEITRLKTEVAPRKAQVKEATASADAAMEVVKTESNDARITMNGFFRAAALTTLMAEPAPPAAGDVPLPEVKPDPLKTTITSKDGAYFDSTAGLAIFLKDVEVKNPEFQLKGAEELKIFMNPEKAVEVKPKGAPKSSADQPDTKPEGSPKPETTEITPEMAEKMRAAKEAAAKLGDANKGGNFGDVKRLVATGVVEIFYKSKDPKEEPLMASARTVIYDLEKEQIILRGGSPWILREGKLTRVKGEEAYFLVYIKDGDPIKFVTGNQEMLETEFSTPPSEAEKKPEAPKTQKPQNR